MFNRLIFLDIDGVMSSSGHVKVENANRYPIRLNKAAVSALNEIVLMSDAKVVITSTFKREFSVGEIHRMFIEQGVVDCIIGVTPNGSTRENEIEKYLSTTVCTNYLVLDDNNLFNGNNEHFLLVNTGTLLIEHVLECLKILNCSDDNSSMTRLSFEKMSYLETIKYVDMDSLDIYTNKKHFKDRYKKPSNNNYPREALTPVINETPKINRNDLCPCGSGKKYKKCCL